MEKRTMRRVSLLIVSTAAIALALFIGHPHANAAVNNDVGIVAQ